MSKWTEKSRREHIENRRRGSAVWQFIHLCGSLRLAMVELLTLPVACAIATIYESKFNAQIAQAYVYKAPWFIFWLGVLCIDFFCVTLTRWPWQRKHLGFVITHYGIILLLIGAAVGQKLGFEANVTLHTGQPATNKLVINRTILQVESGLDRVAYKVPFNVEIRPPKPEKPRSVALPGSPLKLRVDEYSEKLVESTELAESPLPNGSSGVALEFSSAMMGQTLPLNLVRQPASASTNDFFGLGRIEFLDPLPDRSGAKPPADAFHETQMVFAKYEPVVSNPGGKPSGYQVSLLMQGAQPQVVIESPKGKREMFELSSLIGKPPVTLQGETRLLVKNYWPDLEMREGQPVSKSNDPNNPAILVVLSNDGTGQKEKPLLEIAASGKEGIRYQVSRGGVLQASGESAVGESFPVGWADWKVTVNQIYAKAALRTRLDPATGPVANPVVPGIHARLVDPDARTEGEPAWIQSGRGVVLKNGGKTAFVGFGLEVHPLEFNVELLRFEVPRDEGTETPADFRSTVRFTDPKRGETLEALIHMNHPASFPAGFWRVLLGRNYKFSQAQWNPQDLGETTLQVLHDPGWPLKWIGSLLICLGITIMFYLKPAPKEKRS